MRRLTAMNFIQQFSWAAIIITLPLYLIEKGIDVEEIGLILSLVPVAMLFLRTFLAMLADIIGTKMFFVIHGIMQALTAGTYMVAATPLFFGLGKIFEGTSYSFFWAVDRTAIFLTATKKGIAATKMSTVRMIAAAAGLGLGGFLAWEFSFEAVYMLLLGLGVITFFLGLSRHNTPSHKEIKLLETLDLKKKDKIFWESTLALGFVVAYFSLLFGFLLPVFMDIALDLDYAAIGLFGMLFFLGISLGMYVAGRLELEEKKLFILQLLTLPLIVLLPYTGNFFVPILVLVGIGSGITFGIYEELVAELTDREENISTSVAILNIPGRAMEFGVLAASGFIFTILGYEALFVLCAIFLLAFVIMAKFILGKLERGRAKIKEAQVTIDVEKKVKKKKP